MSEQPHAAHGDDHGHHGSPWVQHHYDDAQHQFDSGKLGIWLFLAQEILFFSALFVAYILYRVHHPEIYEYAHKYLDTKMGAINTAVLIFSSLTAAWAVRAAQLGQKKLLVSLLAVTIACACGFLVVKYFEYTHKIHEHILFGKRFDPCVSSNGSPLPTKNNECPGSKSTVTWDFSKNVGTGCFPDVAIDSDLRAPGLQTSCKVYEAKGKLVEAADKSLTFKEVSRKEVLPKCFDGTLGPDGGLEPNAKVAFPCWKASHQPAVCKQGWFFPWTCQGEKCEKAAGGEGPFVSLAECSSKRTAKETALKALGTAEAGECAHGQASAFVVEYNDHEERESPTKEEDGTKIVVDCAGPASVTPIDYTKDLPSLEPTVGVKTTTHKHALTHHEEKEIAYSGPPPEHTNMFFTIYFAMTGLHGIHVLVGIFIFIWLLIRATKGHFTPDYFGPIDFAALYWHIVDLIWIFLFPLLYLIH